MFTVTLSAGTPQHCTHRHGTAAGVTQNLAVQTSGGAGAAGDTTYVSALVGRDAIEHAVQLTVWVTRVRVASVCVRHTPVVSMWARGTLH
jgi:hypothetical protein